MNKLLNIISICTVFFASSVALAEGTTTTYHVYAIPNVIDYPDSQAQIFNDGTACSMTINGKTVTAYTATKTAGETEDKKEISGEVCKHGNFGSKACCHFSFTGRINVHEGATTDCVQNYPSGTDTVIVTYKGPSASSLIANIPNCK